MEIAYVSHDEVHQSLAAELALAFGAVIRARRPGEDPDDRRFDAVLYDLDAVERRSRTDLLTRILSRSRSRPTGVHGYEISDAQAAALRRRGVAVAQRLRPELFWALCGAARRGLASVPPDDALADETWSTEACPANRALTRGGS